MGIPALRHSPFFIDAAALAVDANDASVDVAGQGQVKGVSRKAKRALPFESNRIGNEIIARLADSDGTAISGREGDCAAVCGVVRTVGFVSVGECDSDGPLTFIPSSFQGEMKSTSRDKKMALTALENPPIPVPVSVMSALGGGMPLTMF